ncbi:hypothetical protein [Kribbella sp. NPDC050470]|uniref:hypothetical protein n=1 Tax=unclassified Kribbella TaxID=2644121 RepID=UPI0037B11D3A
MTATLVASHAATSPDDLLARSAPAAVAISGADQSAWNGEIVQTTDGVLGLAHWDGTLYLGDGILDPLRQMYERAGQTQPVTDLISYREALATLLHEHAHFLGPAGASQEAARGAFIQPGSRQLEEGIAEAWAQDHLDEFLIRLGVDEVAPGIHDVESTGYYPAFVPAIRILTTDLETRAGLDQGEVLNTLNRQTAEGQFPLLVGLLYNSTCLPDLDTPTQATSTRNRLELLLREGLSHLDTYQLHPPGHAAARSRSTTALLLTHLQSELTSAESAHHPHPTACDLPAPTPIPTPSTAPAPTPTPAQASAAGQPSAVPSRLIPSQSTQHAFYTALAGLPPPTLTPTTTPTSASPPPRPTPTSQALSR